MTQVTLRATLSSKLSSKPAARRRQADHILAAAFETELGWMALAHCDEVLAGVVFGHASKRQAMESLRRYLRRGEATPSLVDFLEVEEQPESIFGVIERLRAYATGEEVDFSDVRVDERHLTDFGRRVVRAC